MNCLSFDILIVYMQLGISLVVALSEFCTWNRFTCLPSSSRQKRQQRTSHMIINSEIKIMIIIVYKNKTGCKLNIITFNEAFGVLFVHFKFSSENEYTI